jgi:hypothetical protein
MMKEREAVISPKNEERIAGKEMGGHHAKIYGN